MDRPPRLVSVDSSSRCSSELMTHPARCSRTRRSLRSFFRSDMRSRTSTQSAFQFSMAWNRSGSASGRTNSWQSVSTARILSRRCRSSDSLARMSSSRSTISFSRSRMRVAADSARSMRREWRCWVGLLAVVYTCAVSGRRKLTSDSSLRDCSFWTTAASSRLSFSASRAMRSAMSH